MWPAIDHFATDKGFIYAGYIAFASLFALFPFLLFMVTLAGFLGQGAAAPAGDEAGTGERGLSPTIGIDGFR